MMKKKTSNNTFQKFQLLLAFYARLVECFD
jgi:hypothetical protein